MSNWFRCACGHPAEEHYESGPTECDRDGCSCKHYRPDPALVAAEVAKANEILSRENASK